MEYQNAKDELLRETPVPVIWLFGKTGAGKSSIIRYLTGVESIEIGTGYKPQTRFSSRYDFPSESEPLMRFLDTRGLGEVDYDPSEEISQFGGQTHLMIVVVRAMDHAVDELLGPLEKIRAAAPHRPVILALTALHDAYPGEQHPEEDPFLLSLGPCPLPEGIDPDLTRSLARQYERYRGLFDRAVPLDLTPPDEGFLESNFGGERLKTSIIESLPAAYRQVLLQLDELTIDHQDLMRRRTMPVILGTSTLAATAAAIPLPWVDIPVVMGLQSHLVYKIAQIHNQQIDGRTIAKVTGGLGGRLAVRMAIRETLKFIPWVGMAANAAASFAYTFATGMVWNWYFTRVGKGHVPTEDELKNVFQEQLLQATELWRKTRSSAGTPNV
ncbi:MAG: 50S ribosome-binding GTPase [Planctomycetaceae bacterium]|nr:50S ribosome-binding GTPase [Planctomycetaceae bacterium]